MNDADAETAVILVRDAIRETVANNGAVAGICGSLGTWTACAFDQIRAGELRKEEALVVLLDTSRRILEL